MTAPGPSDGDGLDVLFIDNFDSFVFNLVDEFRKRKCRVRVWRNDLGTDRMLALIDGLRRPGLVVLSPGPGTPARSGGCIELLRRMPKGCPVFGVCLGMQLIVEACGGEVGRASHIVHGKSTPLIHDGRGIFDRLPNPMPVGRYHSLAGLVIPGELEVTARSEDVVMAVRHQARPLIGVQFHPESILTPCGGELIENVIAGAKAWNGASDAFRSVENRSCNRI
jgi:anthranilate synthase/aminodeoxychorismate synthase-like glutamine amidotransferase